MKSEATPGNGQLELLLEMGGVLTVAAPRISSKIALAAAIRGLGSAASSANASRSAATHTGSGEPGRSPGNQRAPR